MKKIAIILALVLALAAVAGCMEAPASSPSDPSAAVPSASVSSAATEDGETPETEEPITPEVPVAGDVRIDGDTVKIWDSVTDASPLLQYTFAFDESSGAISVGAANGDKVLLKDSLSDVLSFETDGIHIVDVNFDGKKDILLVKEIVGVHSNYYYAAWLWDDTAGVFTRESGINDVANIALDAGNERLLSVVTNSAASHTYSIYKFVDGTLKLTNQLLIEAIEEDKYAEHELTELTPSDDPWLFVEEALQDDGQWVKVEDFIVIYPNDVEGAAKVDSLYFKKGTSWDVEGAQWFAGDFGQNLF
ncbi:MAG: hypothetical protein LBN30_07805 [Oscillospiraceae bacterium]|jgi:hypothetical protein|nr:hypothetical protein [Oscillospiraceae bacterium]